MFRPFFIISYITCIVTARQPAMLDNKTNIQQNQIKNQLIKANKQQQQNNLQIQTNKKFYQIVLIIDCKSNKKKVWPGKMGNIFSSYDISMDELTFFPIKP